MVPPNAPRVYSQHMIKSLKDFGLQQSKIDPCVFYQVKYQHQHRADYLALTVYVDDFISGQQKIGPNSLGHHLWDHLHKRYNIIEQPPSTKFTFIGLEIEEHEDHIKIHQEPLVISLLKATGMSTCKPQPTPADSNLKLLPTTEEEKQGDDLNGVTYRSIIGSLLWLRNTRPDLAHIISKLSSFCVHPSKHHLTAVKRVLRYLAGTSKHGLHFPRECKPEQAGLVIYSDSDYAGDHTKSKSTSGYISIFHGCAISWSSRKQSTTALSTLEAEYTALCEATRDAIGWSNFFEQINHTLPSRPRILCDNQAAVIHGEEYRYQPKLRHISVSYHYTREQVLAGKVDLNWIAGEDNVADIMTKHVTKKVFQHLTPFFLMS